MNHGAGPTSLFLAEHSSEPQFVELAKDTNGGLSEPSFGPGRVAWGKLGDNANWQVNMRCLAPLD